MLALSQPFLTLLNSIIALLVPCNPSNSHRNNQHQRRRYFNRIGGYGTRESKRAFGLGVAKWGYLLGEVGLEMVDLFRVGRVN